MALDFRIEIEEGVEAGSELLLDLFFAAFKHVHGDVRLATVVQLQRGIADFFHLFRGEEPEPVN